MNAIGMSRRATTISAAIDEPDVSETIQAGIIGGLVGGVTIWIYEAIVWVGVQHLMPLTGIPRNATGLVFGKAVQDNLGGVAYIIGTGIHFSSALRGEWRLPFRGPDFGVADTRQR